jgi:hypothetical protein
MAGTTKCRSDSDKGLSDSERNQRVESDMRGPRQSLETVVRDVDATLKAVYLKGLPTTMPNWIAMHATLMHGRSSYANRNAPETSSLKSVFARLLDSKSERRGPFVLRGERPWPRHSGNRFDQEHHRDQFLHYLSMAGVPLEADLFVDGRAFHLRDLLDQSLLEARPSGQLAFTVSAYAFYLQGSRTWSNKFEETLSLAPLVRRLLNSPDSSCAGAHRLGGLARVLAAPNLQQMGEMADLWPDIEWHVNQELKRLRQRKSTDGSFELPPESKVAIQNETHRGTERLVVFYTGHTLEWLMWVLNDREIQEDWIIDAARRLASAVRATYDMAVAELDASGTDDAHYQFGEVAHAVSGLRRWRDRIKGPMITREPDSH